MGPAARAGHLQVATFDDRHNDFLRSVKLLRDFGRTETTDFVGLVQTNALSNKIDLYLHRELDYRAEVRDGQLFATATVRLRSIIPEDAPTFALGIGDDLGRNRILLSLYSPHALQQVSINGVSAEFGTTREFDLERYLVDITLPPTPDEFVIEFELFGLPPIDETYSLEVWHQPLVNSDEVTVSYQGPEGQIAWQGPLVENVILRSENLPD